jgi:hypothetical protein
MALPPEHVTPEISRLRDAVSAIPFEQINSYPDLIRSDYETIGKYVIMYSYVDLNLRRCVEVFAQCGMLLPKYAKDHHSIRAGYLVDAIIPVVDRMPPDIENIAFTTDTLRAIQRGREMRNVLAHWAAKRVPNENAFIMVTKDEQDAHRCGRELGELGLATALVYVHDIRSACQYVAERQRWLGEKTGEWIKRYIER